MNLLQQFKDRRMPYSNPDRYRVFQCLEHTLILQNVTNSDHACKKEVAKKLTHSANETRESVFGTRLL
jgi:hypothetical protein